MLTESKITIAVSGISGNTALVISGYEFLQIYLFGLNSSEELSSLDSNTIKATKIKRNKKGTVTFETGTQSDSDPRLHTVSPSTVLQHKSRYTAYWFHEIWSHRSKFVDWKENKAWWDKTYLTRKYMLENGGFKDLVNISGSYSDQKYRNSATLYLNQFCDRNYSETNYYKSHKKIFWLMCTTDAKNPDQQEEEKIISKAKKAKFKKGKTQEEITYLTVEQAKKDQMKNKKVDSNKSKFIVYDYSKEWWEWSYKYRLKVDKKDETSSFPLSKKFKDATKGWDDSINDAGALNKVCKDFYDASNNNSQNEIDDAWRYCSDAGREQISNK
ncbi:hypothetical protein [Candidatus Mycoplasma haematohominis]|uniref:Uncharacterized protein n=1 Tax=Candidatus Mycoplasma haematohominis TaxID=1494318 RepID=A0A478FQH7_9MOLU|nr:hypothetical protein [Candidatus Mycoplasma haemohominis]GCE63592.1 hypothetical protein MHSWG343_05890 [Candidatus Mycoplasma haemohominis]